MKALMISAGVVTIMGLASCEKDHTCVCFNSNNDITHTYTYGSTNREEARELCAEAAVLLNEADSLGQTYICTLEQK